MTDFEAELARYLAEPGPAEQTDVAERIIEVVRRQDRADRRASMLAACLWGLALTFTAVVGCAVAEHALAAFPFKTVQAAAVRLPFAMVAAAVAMAAGVVVAALMGDGRGRRREPA